MGVAAERQIPDTSRPNGKKPRATRFDAVSVGIQTNNATEQKPIDVKEAVEKLSKLARSQKKYVNFSVDEETNSSVIKIFENETGKLIKQFPVEEILAMIAYIRKNIGWLIDRKA
ncbi:flagellar protein FlaG [candidate division KSB1 bacterium]|nr:flagellar protein FlaG [candidate division KSB1 bacterium]